ncbi:MAG: hypothetical protein BV457_00235 [Thermoplasmata archaeon M9B1D]|nr:MAG: hypothetical protein BV457_00235 [Thermoplasmata archaeon M9B1D]PNX52207.1 MAG: hypothetical protein BV456_00060 [Thermoplasmata archaeon M8B2D]
MPETKAKARARAKKLGFPLSNVVKGKKGYYLAPRGIKKSSSKKAYSSCRDSGMSKTRCSKIVWSIEKKKKRKKSAKKK